jgi:hypothetical protein
MNKSLTSNPTAVKGLDYIGYANGETAVANHNSIWDCPKYSEAIAYWDYNVVSNLLAVKYKNSDTYYNYEGVPFTAMFGLLMADSLGAYIATVIKPRYGVVKA